MQTESAADYMVPQDIAQMLFSEAAQAWLWTRKSFISPRTFFDYTKYIKTLCVFFAEVRINEITADHLRAYQKIRLTRASPRKVNQECSIIQQIRKRLGTWASIGPDYQPLPVSYESPGRALDERQQDRLFRVAASKPHWEMAYLFALVSVNTTAGPQEVWTLRHQDVDLADGTMKVQPEGAKNLHRRRLIPLNPVAFAAMDRIIELAKRRGSTEPHHYIFPFRTRGNAYTGTYEPTKHCTTCKSAWKALTEASDLVGLRPYDLRHTAITTILQNADVSEETTKAIAGHVSQRILKTYSHIRIDAKRAALDALVGKSAQGADIPMLDSSTVDQVDEVPAFRNQDVLDMLTGLSPRIVAEQIKHAPGNFDTSPEALKKLQSQGVPEVVILAMFHAKKRRAA